MLVILQVIGLVNVFHVKIQLRTCSQKELKLYGQQSHVTCQLQVSFVPRNGTSIDAPVPGSICGTQKHHFWYICGGSISSRIAPSNTTTTPCIVQVETVAHCSTCTVSRFFEQHELIQEASIPCITSRGPRAIPMLPPRP